MEDKKERGIIIIGHIDHGKTTLTAAISSILNSKQMIHEVKSLNEIEENRGMKNKQSLTEKPICSIFAESKLVPDSFEDDSIDYFKKFQGKRKGKSNKRSKRK